MKFNSNQFIYFDQCDPAGILFYNEVFTVTHRTLEQFLDHIGLGWNSWFANELLAVPIKHCEAQFFKPIFAGKSYSVQLILQKISNSSVTFQFHVLDKNMDLHSEVISTHVFVDKKLNQKTNVPTLFRDKLNPYLQQS